MTQRGVRKTRGRWRQSMKIHIAKTAGFCMGVRRAMNMTMGAVKKYNPPIYTFGPLIHNAQALDILKERGVSIINHIPDKTTAAVIIRAHGVPPKIKHQLAGAAQYLLDATCPRVIEVQTIIAAHAARGYSAIIAGDPDHPEVVGLLGYAKNRGHVIDSIEALGALPHFEKSIIVAQTTQNISFYNDVKKWAAAVRPHYKLFDTICNSTSRRQAEVTEMAQFGDIFIVVGGKNSGNTKRLAQIARQSGKPVHHIETEAEIDIHQIKAFENICITAGASTPNWVIQKVVEKIESAI